MVGFLLRKEPTLQLLFIGKLMMLCPCGSQKFYIACCGRYLDAGQIPSTPEALMRSRYTAYTQANIDYIQKTMRGKAAQNYNAEETRIWAQKADWQKLEVVKASDISSKS